MAVFEIALTSVCIVLIEALLRAFGPTLSGLANGHDTVRKNGKRTPGNGLAHLCLPWHNGKSEEGKAEIISERPSTKKKINK